MNFHVERFAQAIVREGLNHERFFVERERPLFAAEVVFAVIASIGIILTVPFSRCCQWFAGRNHILHTDNCHGYRSHAQSASPSHLAVSIVVRSGLFPTLCWLFLRLVGVEAKECASRTFFWG